MPQTSDDDNFFMVACRGLPGTFSGPSQKGPCRDEAASQETAGQISCQVDQW